MSDTPNDPYADAPSPDADGDVVAGRQPPSTRTSLSRERIVLAAMEYIEADGLSGLSMRRLGGALGVEAMSLYRYVAGREVLLDQVVETVMAVMDTDPDVITEPQHGWQDFLQRIAHGMRRTALSHPKCFPLVASRPVEAPWLRPPMRSLDWVERFLAGLVAEGFTDEAAVEAYRAFSSFLLGHLLLEVAGLGADLGPLDVLEEAPEGRDDAHPTVHRLRSSLKENHAAAEFDEALEHLLNRLALVRSEQ